MKVENNKVVKFIYALLKKTLGRNMKTMSFVSKVHEIPINSPKKKKRKNCVICVILTTLTLVQVLSLTILRVKTIFEYFKRNEAE